MTLYKIKEIKRGVVGGNAEMEGGGRWWTGQIRRPNRGEALGGFSDAFDQRIMGFGVESGELEQEFMNQW